VEGSTSIVTNSGRLVPIQIPKNASVSIATALGLPRQRHKSRRMLERLHDDGGMTFIACVRHPLERLVSWHNYHVIKDTAVYVGAGVHGFRIWVGEGCPHKFATPCPHMHPYEQWRWLDGSKGSLRVLRHESLDEDWTLLREDFPDIAPSLLKTNFSKPYKWTDYYDRQTLDRALCVVWNDFEKLGDTYNWKIPNE
jgi:hypothetical protein